MRLASIASEAWRNTISGTTRAAVLAVLVAALSGVLVALDASTIAAQVRDAAAFQAAAADVSVLDAPGRVDGAACDRLSDLPGVRSAGAVRRLERPLRVAALPGADIPSWESTPGMTAVLTGQDDTDNPNKGGVLISQELAEQMRVSAGDALSFTLAAVHTENNETATPARVHQRRTAGPATGRVAAVYDYPADGRLPLLEYAWLSPAPAAGAWDACWARVWPTDPATTALLRTALIPALDPSNDTTVTLQPLNATLGDGFDGHHRYNSRSTAYASVAGMLAGFVLGMVGVRLRRLELASARHAGVGRLVQLGQILLETLLWLVIGALLAWPSALLMVQGMEAADAASVIRTSTAIVSLTSGGAVVGAAAAAWSIREADLFRYFKDR